MFRFMVFMGLLEFMVSGGVICFITLFQSKEPGWLEETFIILWLTIIEEAASSEGVNWFILESNYASSRRY